MDEAVFIALSQQHMVSFYRTAYSIVNNRPDAEDAVQQALLKAWKARSQARRGAERAWMMQIVRNECLSILRRRKREIPSDSTLQTAVSPEPPDPALRDALHALPESLRTPFLLKYMEGMTEKEVAATMGLAHSAVKNRLFRARKALQTTLNREVDV